MAGKDEIRRLQAHLTAGDITRKHYNDRLRDLYDDGQMNKADYEAALDFDPREIADEELADKKNEALELLGLKPPAEKDKPSHDPKYTLRIAAGLEMMGVKREGD